MSDARKGTANLTLGRTMAAFIAALVLPFTLGAAPKTIPDPKPDFAAIDYLIGTWTCKAGLNGGPLHPLTTEYSYDLDGRWIREHSVSPAHDSTRSFPYLYNSNTGFDRVKKQWVQLGTSNTGDYSIGYAPFAADGTLAFTSTMVSGATRTIGHGTWTKISDTEMRYVGSDSSGVHYTQVCVKSH